MSKLVGKPNMPDKYSQGLFPVKNPSKYIGDLSRVYYRSSWEFRFMAYCDSREQVLRWSSELLEIPYVCESRDQSGSLVMRAGRYVPDFYVETLGPGGTVVKTVVEVKPYAETVRPKQPKNNGPKTMKNYEYAVNTYIKNVRKWDHAKRWCEERGMLFRLVTERDLF